MEVNTLKRKQACSLSCVYLAFIRSLYNPLSSDLPQHTEKLNALTAAQTESGISDTYKLFLAQQKQRLERWQSAETVSVDGNVIKVGFAYRSALTEANLKPLDIGTEQKQLTTTTTKSLSDDSSLTNSIYAYTQADDPSGYLNERLESYNRALRSLKGAELGIEKELTVDVKAHPLYEAYYAFTQDLLTRDTPEIGAKIEELLGAIVPDVYNYKNAEATFYQLTSSSNSCTLQIRNCANSLALSTNTDNSLLAEEKLLPLKALMDEAKVLFDERKASYLKLLAEFNQAQTAYNTLLNGNTEGTTGLLKLFDNYESARYTLQQWEEILEYCDPSRFVTQDRHL